VYGWELSHGAEQELDGFPIACVEALNEFLKAVVFDPWDFGRTPDEPPGRPHRTVAFGAGFGLVSFLIMDWEELVWVTRINWLG